MTSSNSRFAESTRSCGINEGSAAPILTAHAQGLQRCPTPRNSASTPISRGDLLVRPESRTVHRNRYLLPALRPMSEPGAGLHVHSLGR